MSEFNKYSTDGGATFIDVEDTNGRIMSEQLIRNTVGWTGKNKAYPFKSTTNNNVTYTVNSDYSVTISTTNAGASADTNCVVNLKSNPFLPAGEYILTDGLETPNSNVYLYVNYYDDSWHDVVRSNWSNTKFTFNPNLGTQAFYALFVKSGTVITTPITIYPMIRLATIPDSTYEPYHEPVGNMCATGAHYTVGIYACLTPNNGKNPECFIPWNNPNRKTITFGDNVKISERTSNGWNELAQDSKPTVLYTCENGFHIYFNLTTALQSNTPYTFKIQGDLVFS